ncbi:putative ATPase/DNA-binding SARP family transcriptional activator [Actinomadura namibiensis]|uniref:Putative ATPase/DNA-binding SARP family transcriptional activator n=1 Tax=Actinomadura namibiensis TaxID=182080 RepID=A0A7W3LLU8_ACTNM|nr:BTAD domain-containing putative transcriptional regulator [Actinomadura namibiensis]MBA8950536.1 putative ATPase/DNA-binding SARP family transcriptional activator [Actinomadura namibiensis]
MRIALLGPVQVFADDASPIPVGGARLRMLLARLALEGGRPVPVDALVDGLWGEEPPADAANALQALVSRLRRALRGAGTVEGAGGGYRLSVRGTDVDAHRFEELAAQGGRELAAGRAEQASSVLGAALGLWRGTALADVRDAPFAGAVATRLEDLRATAAEDRFAAEIRLGRHAGVLADLEAAHTGRPLGERLAALRMRALAAAGRQSDALAVYEDVRARLADELGVDPSPDLRETHLALLRGELDRPAGRAGPAPARLPAPLTSFVGRDTELERLAELMTSARLVTLVGPGGAGKTRLSLEAAARDRAYGHGRVWFVPLAGITAPDQLTDAVLGALAPRDRRLADSGRAFDRVTELLDVGDALLVLDNCEHLVQAAAELAERLLAHLPHLRVLATSREPLAIIGEALCHLGPLPPPAATAGPAEAAASPAVRLFTDRAAGVRPDFALDDSTVRAVVEICRRLDGLPLALELAAAKLRAMNVDQIARRLDDRFRLLTSGSRTALPRQRTLLALIEWSWDLLDEPERALARRLSVFPGGATVTALEGVCSDERLPAGDVLHVLNALVEKSLVHASDDDEPRYRMLETVRAYASSRLAESGDEVSSRFAAYFLALAEEHDPLLRTRDQLRAVALLDAEHDNLVAALRATGDAATTARFVRALFWYWGLRGMVAPFETFVTEALESGDTLPARTRASLDAIRTMVGAMPGDTAEARALVEACERTGAHDFHPALPVWIPMLAFSSGNADLGEPLLRRALDHPDPWVRAVAHWARDDIGTERGDPRSGAGSRLAALRGFEELGDRWGLALALFAVGHAHSLDGDHASALAALERGVAVSSELGTQDDLFSVRIRLTEERMRSGDLDGAHRDLDAARRRAAERGHQRFGGDLLFVLADLHRRSGDPAAAEATLDRLEPAADRLSLPRDSALDLIAAARMTNRLAENDAAGARSLLPRAAAGLAARDDNRGLARTAELLAWLLALEDDPRGAATALGLSEAIRGAFDHGDPELRALTATLTERLGEPAYQTAYAAGAGLPRDEALTRLAEQTAL